MFPFLFDVLMLSVALGGTLIASVCYQLGDVKLNEKNAGFILFLWLLTGANYLMRFADPPLPRELHLVDAAAAFAFFIGLIVVNWRPLDLVGIQFEDEKRARKLKELQDEKAAIEARREATFAATGLRATEELIEMSIELAKARKEERLAEALGGFPANGPTKSHDTINPILEAAYRVRNEKLARGEDASEEEKIISMLRR